MGLMTTAIMTYAFTPLSSFWSGFNNFFLRVGKARAAAELTRLGYHEEAKRLMLLDE